MKVLPWLAGSPTCNERVKEPYLYISFRILGVRPKTYFLISTVVRVTLRKLKDTHIAQISDLAATLKEIREGEKAIFLKRSSLFSA